MDFKIINKFCLECNNKLTLNNTRDIDRKNFCNHSCKAKYYHKIGTMNKPPIGTHTKPHTDSTKKRISKSLSGKNHPYFGKKRPEISGENSVHWIKDRTKLKINFRNNSKRNCPEYKEWRQKIFERDNYVCRMCYQSGSKLEAHHIIPYAVEEYRYDIWNGITLCLVCHKWIHKDKRKWKMELKNAFA